MSDAIERARAWLKELDAALMGVACPENAERCPVLNRDSPSPVTLADLRELLAIAEARGWRSMESAPKDGTVVLITFGAPQQTSGEAYFERDNEPLPHGNWVLTRHHHAMIVPCNVTHWQPLPPPPKNPTNGHPAPLTNP